MSKPIPDARIGKYMPWARAVFDWFIFRTMRRDFSALHLLGTLPKVPEGTRIIFVANHTSWWDGFFLFRIHRLLAPKQQLYSVMLAREFYQTFWFRVIGMLPITPGSTSSIRQLLRRLVRLKNSLETSGFLCSFFPQGEIKPSFTRPLGFSDGLRGVAGAMAPVVLLPIGIHIEPMCERRPQAFLTLGKPIEHISGQLDVGRVEAELTQVLDALLNQLKAKGEHIFLAQSGEAMTHVSLF